MSFIKSCIHFVRTVMKEVDDDSLSAYSAHAAFFIMISFFPFIMFLLTLVQYLPFTKSELLASMTSVFPVTFHSLMVSIITEIYDKASGTIISITVITALWSASRGILSIIRGLNSIYDINETRGYIRLRATSAVYTLIFALALIVCLGFLVFGNQLFVWVTAKLPILNNLALLIISMRTIVGLCLLILFFVVLYLFIPNRKSDFISELPGAVISAVGWMGFSYLYSFYIDNMGNYSYTYGSLTAIVLLMLWLYACMYILFIGGEVNMILKENKLTIYKRRRR